MAARKSAIIAKGLAIYDGCVDGKAWVRKMVK